MKAPLTPVPSESTAKVEDAPVAAKPGAVTAATVQVEARALLTSWIEVQNTYDFEAYIGNYPKQYFKGVKRTSSGKLKNYDFEGWKADRSRKRPPCRCRHS